MSAPKLWADGPALLANAAGRLAASRNKTMCKATLDQALDASLVALRPWTPLKQARPLLNEAIDFFVEYLEQTGKLRGCSFEDWLSGWSGRCTVVVAYAMEAAAAKWDAELTIARECSSPDAAREDAQAFAAAYRKVLERGELHADYDFVPPAWSAGRQVVSV